MRKQKKVTSAWVAEVVGEEGRRRIWRQFGFRSCCEVNYFFMKFLMAGGSK